MSQSKEMTLTAIPFVIDSEEKLLEFSKNTTVDGFPGAEHDGMRSIFWVPTESGTNIKMGVVDIDNPAGLSPKALKKYVGKIYKRLAFDLEHPAIIMFTGMSYQIWIGHNGNETIVNTREMNDYLKSVL